LKSQRGAVPVLVLVAAGVLALVALLVPSWHLPALFQSKPPVAKLDQAQVQLEAAQAAQAKAEAALSAAKAKEEQARLDQLHYAQEMLSGVSQSLAKVSIQSQGPEVALAAQLAVKAESGLSAAIGALPVTEQTEITQLVAQALSAVQAQRDAAMATLATRDAQLLNETQARTALDRQLPVLAAQVATANAQVQVQGAAVAAKTLEVSNWAQKMSAAEQKAGSLDAYAGNLVRVLVICGLIYLFVHFIMPSLAQEYPASKVLSFVYRWLTSLFSAHSVTTTPVPVPPKP
jgi:hypothetical protein